MRNDWLWILSVTLLCAGCGTSQQSDDQPIDGPTNAETDNTDGDDEKADDTTHVAERETDVDDGKKPEPPEALKIGDKVPDFEVTIDGQTWTLADLQKKAEQSGDGTIALTFWCSFCHSCRDIEAALDALAEEFKGRAGVFAIDSSAGETTKDVKEAADRAGINLPIALNKDGSLADLFGVKVTTTTVVIDRDGILRYRGQFADKQHAYAKEALVALLDGQPVAVNETRHRG